MWAGGKPLTSGQTYDLRLPFNGELTARVSEGNQDSFEQACAAAEAGASAMRQLSNAERSDLLLRASVLLERDNAEFARLLTLETGKPVKEARLEANRR